MKRGSQSRLRRRGSWTVILVPPHPTAPSRQVSVSTRSLAIVGLTALAFVGAAATWTGESTSIAATTADRLAESQRMVVALLDSVNALNVVASAAKAARLPPRNMMMPVMGHITSQFSRSRLHPILDIFRAHRGVDLAAPVGTRIVAPASGRVVSVGWRFGYGLTIELQHSGNIATRYAHCRSALVKAGDHVNEGDPIATVGESGLTTGPHVHFEVLVRGEQVDPIHFLAASRDTLAADRVAEGTK
ncbi:MAG TPA: M23 family metallopeptidase [Gemmatimonadaceae bacterium]